MTTPARRRMDQTGAGSTATIAPIDTSLSELMHDTIAQRAYELYLMRGCEPGHDVEDWLQAEREVMNSDMLALTR